MSSSASLRNPGRPSTGTRRRRPASLSTAALILIPAASIAFGALVNSQFNTPSNPSAALYEPSPTTTPICGVAASAMLCELRGVQVSLGDIHRHTGLDERGTSLAGCKRALDAWGVQTEAVRFTSLAQLPSQLPVLCVMRTKAGLHATVIIRKADEVLVLDGRRSYRTSVADADRYTAQVALVPLEASTPR